MIPCDPHRSSAPCRCQIIPKYRITSKPRQTRLSRKSWNARVGKFFFVIDFFFSLFSLLFFSWDFFFLHANVCKRNLPFLCVQLSMGKQNFRFSTMLKRNSCFTETEKAFFWNGKSLSLVMIETFFLRNENSKFIFNSRSHICMYVTRTWWLGALLKFWKLPRCP